MALSAEQLADFRADIGDQGSPPAFTDDELQRLFTREGEYNKAVLRAYKQLLGSAAKFANYTAGQHSEQKKQIFDNLKDLVALWEADTDNKEQVRIVGVRTVPSQVKDFPYTGEHPENKTVRHNDPLFRRSRRGRGW